MITQSRLKELLHYDPATGVFRWISKSSKSRVRIGDIAGTKCWDGYRRITIEGKDYAAHRLAFLFVEGYFPLAEVDHINGIRDDNRYSNLRHVTHRTNQQNQRQAQRHNQCGLLGVSPHRNVFRASIKHNGKSMYLGCFSTPEEAHAEYLKAKRAIHSGCTI